MRRDSHVEERGGRGGVLPGRHRREAELDRRRGELQEVTAALEQVVVGTRHLVDT